MKKYLTKLLLMVIVLAMSIGASASTDVTTSYIGDITWIVNGGAHGNCQNNHKEANGIGWWNTQTLTGYWHAFAAPDANGGTGESWTAAKGSAGVMMGRTMVLPSGQYKLSFQAFGTTASNASSAIAPNAGDIVAFLTGQDDIDITNTTVHGTTFHDVSFTFDVTTDNSAFEFGIKKTKDDSPAEWCQIKNVKLELLSENVFPVPNDNTSLTYSGGTQELARNHWSVEGQSDGSRFQVYFQQVWVSSGNKLDDATIKGSFTPTQTGVYKVSAWVRAVNESGGAVNGVRIFVGDAETNAYTGSSVVNGKGRLGTYTAMADGVSGTPFDYGFKIKDTDLNWLSFKNVTITYLGSIPETEVNALLAKVPEGKMSAETQSTLSGYVTAFNANKSVANYNNLSLFIPTAEASAALYEKIKANIEEAKASYPDLDASTIEAKYNNGAYADDYDVNKIYSEFSTLYIQSLGEVAPGTNLNGAIFNPSFESGNTHGWTHGVSTDTGVKKSEGDLATSGIDGQYYFNTWWKGVPITQTIEGLPNGVYKINAVVASGDNDNPGLVFLTANDEHVGVLCPTKSGGAARPGEVKVIVNDGKLTIGAVGAADDHTYTAEGHWWYKVDNFQLTFVNTLEGYKAALAAQLTESDAKTLFTENTSAATSVYAIDEAFQTVIRTQKTAGSNYTGAITNPSFETGDLRGWTLNSSSNDQGVKENKENFATTNFDGDYLFNIWTTNGLGGDAITQTIELPNGLYKLTAAAATDAEKSVLLTANGQSTEIAGAGSGVGVEGELTFAVTDGKAIIGAEGKDKTWYKVDNFRLEYVADVQAIDGIAALNTAAPTKAVILNINNVEAIHVGEDYVVVQEIGETNAIGMIINGFTTGATVNSLLSGKLYGTYNKVQHSFTVENNSGNKLTSAQGSVTTTVFTTNDAKTIDNSYRLVELKGVTLSSIVGSDNLIVKDKSGMPMVLDARIYAELYDNENIVDGNVLASLTGITFATMDGNVIVPRSENDIVSGVLWTASSAEGDVMNITLEKTAKLKAGDEIHIELPQQTLASEETLLNINNANGDNIFVLSLKANNVTEGIVSFPITADVEKDITKHGLKIESAAKASIIYVEAGKYADTQDAIWLSESDDIINGLRLGETHFRDVREGDVVTATSTQDELALEIHYAPGYSQNLNSGEPLNAERATNLQDHSLWTSLNATGLTKITFALGNNPRDEKAEAKEGDTFTQNAKEAKVNGMVMTFGGNDTKGAEYEFVEAYPAVNKFNAATNGINTFPVDDEDKAYDPAQKNLPTKGTYYVFEPTKDGQLDVTIDLEKGKKLFVTEDGEALKQFNGITTVTDNQISFPVEATKTYYVFANETNLKYYGFTFEPTKDCENIAKDIATFKLLPEDNADGDTLLLKDAIVTYIKGDNVFVEDESGATIFYRTNIQFYVGQKLNGYIIGQNHKEDNMPQLTKTDKTIYKTFKVTENVTPEGKEMAVADASNELALARFVKFVDVRARKDKNGFNILTNKEKNESIRFEDRFNVFFELPDIIDYVQGIIGITKEGTFVFWPTSKEAPEGVGLTDAEEILLAEAQKLAEDREAVAVGKLDDAIEIALTGVGTGLQAAIDEFKANNAATPSNIVEEDVTSKVGTSKESWTGASGTAGSVKTATGTTTPMAELYNSAGVGTKLQQTITGLDNGFYRAQVFALSHNARGEDGAALNGTSNEVAYVFAQSGNNINKTWITASGVTPGFLDEQSKPVAIKVTEVTDGKLTLGLALDVAKQTGWHAIQIYSLEKVLVTTAKEVYAADKADMQTLIDDATALAADEEKTVGKEELSKALEAAKAAQESIRLNIPEFEEEIAKLRQAIDVFKAPYELLAHAQQLAEDREAVAVGKLDDAIETAQGGDFDGLQAAIDEFNANNAGNAKETYAKDKAAMQTIIDEAEELMANENLLTDKDKLEAAIPAAEAALANNRLNVPEFEEEMAKLRQVINEVKDANHIGGNYLASGKYVLKNVASGLYWGAGNNWGTRASLLDYSEYQTLTMKPDGTYTMESQVSNGGTKYFFNQDGKNLYMDNDNPTALTITPVEVEVEGTEEIIDFDASLYHKWSEVSGTATDNGSANGGVRLNQEVALGDALWGNLSGAVPYKDYANITDYKELRIEGTPGAVIRLMCNRVTDEGPIYEIKPTIPENGKLTIKISDLMFLNGGTPCDFVALQSIKIPAGWQGGTTAATITSMKLVKAGEAKKKVLYTVANGNDYFGYAEEDPNDKPYSASTAILRNGLTADNENALWEIVPATSEALAAATEDKPMDATFLILNPNFGRNNRNSNAWTMVAGNKNLCGGTNENKCAESWRSEFTLSQEIEVANGVYALTAQAALSDYAHLYDGANYPVVYANNVTAPFNNMEGADRESNMDRLSASFAAGNYKVGPIYVEVTDGKLTVGVKGTRTDTWCIWDNFQLTYYGANANIDNISGGAELKELKELREKATELMSDEDIEIAVVKNGLKNALSQTANVSGKEAIKAAIALLKESIDPAEASKTAKNMLPKMKELVDATNVYTEEAYNEYYGTWLAKYEAGTLTKTEAGNLQDPSVTTGWHAQITVDNFLLSAWDTNPDFNNAAYYINSWSVEGDNDGTNFRVPFFEYFIEDGNSLGEKTLTATMNGLESGEYAVTAWARVRVKDNSQTSAYGITFQANDGTAVDVCDGDQTERFFLKEVSATGTVGNDGVLKIKFNVAADNNIHWLSFKNVKFEKVPVTDIHSINAKADNDNIYNLRGQKVENTLKKGLYIINGKKVVVK